MTPAQLRGYSMMPWNYPGTTLNPSSYLTFSKSNASTAHLHGTPQDNRTVYHSILIPPRTPTICVPEIAKRACVRLSYIPTALSQCVLFTVHNIVSTKVYISITCPHSIASSQDTLRTHALSQPSLLDSPSILYTADSCDTSCDSCFHQATVSFRDTSLREASEDPVCALGGGSSWDPTSVSACLLLPSLLLQSMRCPGGRIYD